MISKTSFIGLILVIFLSYLSSAQKVNNTYNTKINRVEKVYIKNAGGNTYISKADSVIIVNPITKVQDTVKLEVKTANSNPSVTQNYFIIDPLPVLAFAHDIEGKYKGYHFVKFSSLTTTQGDSLPIFEVPPSLVIFSPSNSSLKLGDITTNGFYIYTKDKDGETFTAWISEKKKGVIFKPIANAGDDQVIYLRR